MNQLIELAKQWLSHKTKGDVNGIEILPQQTSYGLVVWFYYEQTLKDLEYFLTVPMVRDLLDGVNPKKVKNEFVRSYNEICSTIWGCIPDDKDWAKGTAIYKRNIFKNK